MYGGLIDRVHDLLLCGVDPSMVDLSMCLDHLKSDNQRVYRETESLLRAASHHWTPSHHAYLYGPELKACIASLCLVKVLCPCFDLRLDGILSLVFSTLRRI